MKPALAIAPEFRGLASVYGASYTKTPSAISRTGRGVRASALQPDPGARTSINAAEKDRKPFILPLSNADRNQPSGASGDRGPAAYSTSAAKRPGRSPRPCSTESSVRVSSVVNGMSKTVGTVEGVTPNGLGFPTDRAERKHSHLDRAFERPGGTDLGHHGGGARNEHLPARAHA